MILLDTENMMILAILKKKGIPNENGKYESVDSIVADDDGIKYNIVSSAEDKSKIYVDISIPFYRELSSVKITDFLSKVYGSSFVSPPPARVDIRLLYDASKSAQEKEKSSMDIALFRKYLYASILDHLFTKQISGTSTERVHITIRDGELITFEAQADRVTVIFTLSFTDKQDITIGRVFLNEFKESRKASQSAPQVLVSLKDPPTQLAGLNVPTGVHVGYVTFILTSFQSKEPNRDKTVVAIHNFLPYLKYHMKCSKAFLHSRMRAKAEDLIKILNRARPELKPAEKKTFSGKVFQKT